MGLEVGYPIREAADDVRKAREQILQRKPELLVVVNNCYAQRACHRGSEPSEDRMVDSQS